MNNTLFSMQIGKIGNNIFDEIPLAPEIKEISAMVYNPIHQTIIISDNQSKQIFEFHLKTNAVTLLVDKDIVNVTSIDIG